DSITDRIRSAEFWTSRVVTLIELLVSTAELVALWVALILLAISSVAPAVWLARLLTSWATTAKPRPASPARAASIVALRARRFVWPAMVLIMSRMDWLG